MTGDVSPCPAPAFGSGFPREQENPVRRIPDRALLTLGAFLTALLCALTIVVNANASTYHSGASWYGGPCDRQDNNRPAWGPANTVPGIARYDDATRRGLFLLTDLHTHRRVVAVHSDKGPAPWVASRRTETGWRIRLDVNYTAAMALGYRAPGGCVQGWRYGEKIRVTSLSRRRASWWARRTRTELDSRWIWFRR